MLLPRRRFLLAAAASPFAAAVAATPLTARADSPSPSLSPKTATLPTSTDLEFRDITVPGDKGLANRFLLCVPRHLKPGEKVPLVVLLHGLGETGDPRTGAFAWVERYGLATAYERLRRAPIARTSKRRDWTDPRLAEVNASLAKSPFTGLCLVCPVTPNVAKLPSPTAALDRYASWITDTVLPRARKDAPVYTSPGATSIDGCSLGGYVALEVFLRKPDHFGSVGGCQSAFGEHRAPAYAARLEPALSSTKPAKPLHLLTSDADPFLPGNRKLAALLAAKGVPCDLRVLPGPHDQPWLREAGTLELLLWHHRASRRPRSASGKPAP